MTYHHSTKLVADPGFPVGRAPTLQCKGAMHEIRTFLDRKRGSTCRPDVLPLDPPLSQNKTKLSFGFVWKWKHSVPVPVVIYISFSLSASISYEVTKCKCLSKSSSHNNGILWNRNYLRNQNGLFLDNVAATHMLFVTSSAGEICVLWAHFKNEK